MIYEVIDPVKNAKAYTQAVIAAEGTYTWLDMINTSFVEVAKEEIDEQLLFRQKTLLIRSLLGIEERWLMAVEKGTATKRTALENIDRLSEQSIVESYRRVFLADQALKLSTEGAVSAYGMMLSTTADEPDDDHAHLEGEVIPLSELLKHLERFGCQHTYKVVSKNYYQERGVS